MNENENKGNNVGDSAANSRPDVILAAMRLLRAMRRRPPRREEGFNPGSERLLDVMHGHDGVSSRELAELLDVRPSSLSELLARGENEGLLTRTPDGEDRRVSRVALTEKGREQAERVSKSREERLTRLSACFTDEEAASFCELCERLGNHLEQLAREDGDPEGCMPPSPDFFPGGPGRHHHFPGGHCGEPPFCHRPPRPRKI